MKTQIHIDSLFFFFFLFRTRLLHTILSIQENTTTIKNKLSSDDIAFIVWTMDNGKCVQIRKNFLWVPYRKSSWDSFIAHPSSHCHHSNTAILDFLQSQTGDFCTVESTFSLGKSKWIISVVTWNTSFLVPLTLEGSCFEQSSSKEDLQPSSSRNHLDGIKWSSSSDVRKGNSRS